LSSILSVEGEIVLAQKGAGGPFFPDMRTSYLEIPLLLRLKAPVAGRVRPFFEGGVAPSVELTCRGLTTVPTTGFGPSPVVPLDCGSMRTKRSDLGFLAGGGIQVAIRRTTVTLLARHDSGRSNLSAGFPPVEMYNRSWSLLVGVARPLIGRSRSRPW
jgi:hypothetical protein